MNEGIVELLRGRLPDSHPDRTLTIHQHAGELSVSLQLSSNKTITLVFRMRNNKLVENLATGGGGTFLECPLDPS